MQSLHSLLKFDLLLSRRPWMLIGAGFVVMLSDICRTGATFSQIDIDTIWGMMTRQFYRKLCGWASWMHERSYILRERTRELDIQSLGFSVLFPHFATLACRKMREFHGKVQALDFAELTLLSWSTDLDKSRNWSYDMLVGENPYIASMICRWLPEMVLRNGKSSHSMWHCTDLSNVIMDGNWSSSMHSSDIVQ